MNHSRAILAQPAGAPHRVRLKVLWVAASWCLTAALCGPAASAQTPSTAALPAVVVWDFDNQTPGAAQAGSTSEYLKRSLSENLTASLLQVAGLPVLERQRLKDLLAEQKVSAAELADEDARVRLGRIVGAGRMVFGGFFVLGEQVQVHVRLVDTATSRVLVSDEAVCSLDQVMQQIEPLNRRLARALGAGSATGLSFAAASWQAYDRALALADAGKLEEAVRALQALLGTDKNFVPAERQLVALLDKLARR
jgi:TolB-like protein